MNTERERQRAEQAEGEITRLQEEIRQLRGGKYDGPCALGFFILKMLKTATCGTRNRHHSKVGRHLCIRLQPCSLFHSHR